MIYDVVLLCSMLMFVAEMYVGDWAFDRPAQQIVNAGRKQKRCKVLPLK